MRPSPRKPSALWPDFSALLHPPRSRRALLGVVAVTIGSRAVGLGKPARIGMAQASPIASPPPEDDPEITVWTDYLQVKSDYYRLLEEWPTDRDALAQATPMDFPGQRDLASVLIVHDLAGMNWHIRDVARRICKEGYGVLVLDMVDGNGGTAMVEDPSTIPAILAQRPLEDYVLALRKIITVWTSGPPAEDRFAILGFGFGGTLAWRMAIEDARINTIVTVNGTPPAGSGLASSRATAVASETAVPNAPAASTFQPPITPEIMAIFSAEGAPLTPRDQLNLDKDLTAAGIPHSITTYPGTAADFLDDTSLHFDSDQASRAWSDILSFLRRQLGPNTPFV
jgi:carboxymethylenebutenolidase